jgi:broad specificity phosphatase PhoE
MTIKKRFVFARHANTDKNPVDKERKLTEKGRSQAATLKKKLAKINFDIILCSSCNRAKETLFCLFKKHKNVVFLSELYELLKKEEMESVLEMYKELAPAELKSFLSHKNAYLLEKMGRIGADSIIERTKESKNAFILSHDLVLNCIIRNMFPSLEDLALHSIFNECGAIEILVTKKGKIKAKIIN